MLNKKNVALWASYDFANSLVSIVFFLYFAQWLVVEQGVADFWYNITFTISAIILLLTAPLAGSLLDKHYRRISGLRWTTCIMALFYALCALFVIKSMPWTALIFFTLGFYMYLLSFTFYNPLLSLIASPERQGIVSGMGISANYLGQIAGLLLALPISNGSLSFFGASPRAETLLPSVFLFFLFSLPMLIFFKEPLKAKDKIVFSLKKSWKDMILDTKYLISISSVAFFLLAYFFFNDAIVTAANNFPLFLEQVWGVSDSIKTYILLGILITSVIGGFFGGAIADKYGHKRTLKYILIGFLFIFPVLALSTNFIIFVATTTFMGLWFGANWAVSRSVMTYLAPPEKNGLVFSYFGIAERASSLLGPLIWGGIVSGLVYLGPTRYRFAVIVVTCFIFVGLWALSKVRDDRE